MTGGRNAASTLEVTNLERILCDWRWEVMQHLKFSHTASILRLPTWSRCCVSLGGGWEQQQEAVLKATAMQSNVCFLSIRS